MCGMKLTKMVEQSILFNETGRQTIVPSLFAYPKYGGRAYGST